MVDEAPNREHFDAIVWKIVWQIPHGQVFTYGQIASMIPMPDGLTLPDYTRIAPRWVGYAMNRAMRSALNVGTGAEGASIPWHRVINSQGGISLTEGSYPAEQQRTRLEAEGVIFDADGRVDFDRFGWDGPDDDWLRANDLLKPKSLKRPPSQPGQLSLF
jgi:methylated-DNA-protein-cysteine methyltransferase-like protein